MTQRPDDRPAAQLRPLTLERNVLDTAEGSVLVTAGRTKVLCTATASNDKPAWLNGKSAGWVTAEYGMLPKSCKTRVPRNKNAGRTAEIQRLIGRSLRAVVDLSRIDNFSFILDCDVLQADGGTRTAAITGACVALVDAFRLLHTNGLIARWPLRELVAATSVGIVEGQPLLDLCYTEDSTAQVDMNVVATASGRLVEVQGTAEAQPFTREQHETLLDLACQGIAQLIEIQRSALGALPRWEDE